INIDISFLRMSKRAWQCADDLHAELLPETNGRFVDRDDEIELHRAETQPARFAQAVFTHGPANPTAARCRRDYEGGVGNMSCWARPIRPQNVTAENMSILFGDVSVRPFLEPVGECVLARHFRIKWISVARRDHFMKNFPDRVVIGIIRGANFQHAEQSAFKHEDSRSAPLIRFWIPKRAG